MGGCKHGVLKRIESFITELLQGRQLQLACSLHCGKIAPRRELACPDMAVSMNSPLTVLSLFPQARRLQRTASVPSAATSSTLPEPPLPRPGGPPRPLPCQLPCHRRRRRRPSPSLRSRPAALPGAPQRRSRHAGGLTCTAGAGPFHSPAPLPRPALAAHPAARRSAARRSAAASWARTIPFCRPRALPSAGTSAPQSPRPRHRPPPPPTLGKGPRWCRSAQALWKGRC